jgi:hypothetical protein
VQQQHCNTPQSSYICDFTHVHPYLSQAMAGAQRKAGALGKQRRTEVAHIITTSK